MKWFNNLKIANKLALVFGIVLTLTCILGGFAFTQISTVNDATKEMEGYLIPVLRNTSQLEISALRINSAQQNIASSQSEDPSSTDRKTLTEQFAVAQTSIEVLQKLLRTPEGQEYISSVNKEFQQLIDANNKAFTAIDNQKAYEGFDALHNQIPMLVKSLTTSVRELEGTMNDRIQAVKTASDQTYTSSMILIAVILAVTFVLSFILIVYVSRAISTPLKKASEIAGRVADGDLTSHIESGTKDETGLLIDALAKMNTKLLGIVQQISGGTRTLYRASSEISAGNMDLSSRTEQQASSLEETASAMEELTSTVKQTADNARQANQLASSASTVAVQGGDIVQKVITTMGTINESSRKIEDIISVIDSIAFQTNILALNASVEAARAGEEGRGFAVVAGEVRNLAQRSASAAKEIKDLIDTSVENVEVGNKLVNQAGSTMQQVVESIQRVSDIVGEITAASQEQSTGIEQVNLAITQMDQVTQQNAALVEESAAATKSLEQQSLTLEKLVNAFKFSSAQVALTPASTPIAAASKPALTAQKIAPEVKPAAIAAPKPALSKASIKPEVKKATTSTTKTASTHTSTVRAQSPKSLAPTTVDDKDDWEEF